MTEQLFTNDEFLEYARAFEAHHALFYKFWMLGKPEFRDDIPTAEVRFDAAGNCLSFMFNPTFWKECSVQKRLFVIAHECLHVINDHGIRIRNLDNPLLGNYAADIVVNHALVSKFGFNREEIDPHGSYCWIDTVFKKPDSVMKNKSMEYYYSILAAEKPDLPKLMDDHQWGNSKVIEYLAKSLNTHEQNFVKQYIQTDTTDSPHWVYTASPEFGHKKKKWESIICKWSKKKLRYVEKDESQWIKSNRRFASLSGGLMLPSEYSIECIDKDYETIDVFFFLDSSKSCWSLKDRFFKAASSLPTNRFNVSLFCFDTEIYPTSLESKEILGGGCTLFGVIEDYVQSHIKRTNKAYPEAVFVITDGWGSVVEPEFPERWHWFLTGAETSYIPAGSKIYKLKDYE